MPLIPDTFVPARSDAAASVSLCSIDLWHVHLDGVGAERAPFHPVLTEDERTRAKAFRFDRDRWRWATARIGLRFVLERYSDVSASEIAFRTGAWGKPFVDRVCSEPLFFNLSHSGSRAAVVVGTAEAIGVDIEHVCRHLDFGEIAAYAFSVQERCALDALPEAARPIAALALWTRKEAYVKATGRGLSEALQGFDISITGPPRVLCVNGSRHQASRWALVDLDLGRDYAGSLAVRGQVGTSIRVRDQGAINVHLLD